MTDHERVAAAARAGIVKAHELSLPKFDPKLGIQHEWEKQIERIERVVEEETQARLKEAEESLQMRLTVRKSSKIVFWTAVAFTTFVVIVVCIGAYGLRRISAIADENRGLIDANRRFQVETARQARVVVRIGCKRQDDRDRTLRTIILRSEETIPKLVKEGTLTQKQANRALQASKLARRDLHGGSCMDLASRIPIPSSEVNDK